MKMPKVFYEGMEILLSVIIINIENQSVGFTRIGEVSAENTKYSEHYTSYGDSFRIYGDFEEILK